MRNNDYMGYSLFNEVKDPALRTYNRCTVMLNLNKDHGQDFVVGYGGCMNDVERMQMFAMYQYMAIKGAEVVRTEIARGEHAKVVH